MANAAARKLMDIVGLIALHVQKSNFFPKRLFLTSLGSKVETFELTTIQQKLN
jgi:hypothetical protein